MNDTGGTGDKDARAEEEKHYFDNCGNGSSASARSGYKADGLESRASTVVHTLEASAVRV